MNKLLKYIGYSCKHHDNKEFNLYGIYISELINRRDIWIYLVEKRLAGISN